MRKILNFSHSFRLFAIPPKLIQKYNSMLFLQGANALVRRGRGRQIFSISCYFLKLAKLNVECWRTHILEDQVPPLTENPGSITSNYHQILRPN